MLKTFTNTSVVDFNTKMLQQQIYNPNKTATNVKNVLIGSSQLF